MELVMEYYPLVLQIVTAGATFVVAITSFIKALKSEKRLTTQVNDMVAQTTAINDARYKELENKVTITRAGIVQGFKDAVVTKDIKVSINNQVQKILDEKLAAFEARVQKSEEAKTKLTYWALKILANTAAYNALTTEQQAELDEVLALIAEEEKIIDTII